MSYPIFCHLLHRRRRPMQKVWMGTSLRATNSKNKYPPPTDDSGCNGFVEVPSTGPQPKHAKIFGRDSPTVCVHKQIGIPNLLALLST